MSLFAKSEEEEDETTKTLKATAREESKILRNQDIEKGFKDKVQHAINVEFGIEDDDTNHLDDNRDSITGKGRKLLADDHNDSHNVADVSVSSSKLPKKRNKVGKKEASMKSPSSSSVGDESNNASLKNFDPFFVEESINDEGVEIGTVHSDE